MKIKKVVIILILQNEEELDDLKEDCKRLDEFNVNLLLIIK